MGSLVNGVTSAMVSEATRLPSNRPLIVTTIRVFANKCSGVVLSLDLLLDINDLRITDFI
jgi:hypothetical protein